ncbi:hypothetical protein FRC10_007023 [Ceratobasidium sp. 414]|nr:hypothetical protein FRC10_007023 [Ceratobasidium sp. 414]
MTFIRYTPTKPEDDRVVVWFDIDNTLYPPNEQIVSLVQGKIHNLNLEPDEARALHRKYYTEYDPLDFDAKVDASLPLEELLTPNPAIRKLLEDIDPSKARIWALTNAYKTLEDLFEGMVFCDYGTQNFACKPEQKFYDQALALANTTAEKSYFVDDNFGNVLGAKWGRCAFLYSATLDAKKLAGTNAGGGVGSTNDLESKDKIDVIQRLEDLRKIWPEVFKT